MFPDEGNVILCICQTTEIPSYTAKDESNKSKSATGNDVSQVKEIAKRSIHFPSSPYPYCSFTTNTSALSDPFASVPSVPAQSLVQAKNLPSCDTAPIA